MKETSPPRPKKDLRRVVVLGSAALKIGEAGEFDYSGSQAIKALKEEGIETILINPNIATVQTSDDLANKVYFLPVTVEFVEKVIAAEKPDGILLSCGGQTALNCGLALEKQGILKKYGVRVLGTPVDAIRATEDRKLFCDALDQIQVKTPRSVAVYSLDDAKKAAEDLGFPVMVRIAFALGGLGSGVCRNISELTTLASKALAYTEQILVEEYLQGWKEVEYEVVRDQFDNCITVCNMENLDPLGIHTGESIVVAPSQTLSNTEYHQLREIAIRTVRHLGIVGECNIQYALNPHSSDYRVIEVNARLSRSSALASKATGYPLAWIAAKLSLGYCLYDIKNNVTQITKACFEPALDYIVVKMPRWDLKKFRNVSKKIGTAMKSVGEVMAIGRSFEEALQKTVRMLEIGMDGISSSDKIAGLKTPEAIEEMLRNPTDQRLFAIYEAFRHSYTVEKIRAITFIDPWFLHKIKRIYDTEVRLKRYAHQPIPSEVLLEAKQNGFADKQIGELTGQTELAVRKTRHNYGQHPWVKQIDTLAAEFPAKTNYLYLTYHGCEDDISFEGSAKQPVITLGSGCYRIGSSVEFDWCCVNSVRTLRKLGHPTIMVNYNPETVSTDYDECDRLYFDEISLESIEEIHRKENSQGIIVSMGGQIPNNLSSKLYQAGLPILGTAPDSIDRAEDRNKFSMLLDQLGIKQPPWTEATSFDQVKGFADKVHYPVLIRPSYVLSGAAMAVASNDGELTKFLQAAVDISSEHPVVVSKFIQSAKEIEMDAVAKRGEIVVYAISEHVENAGVHSGDATLVLPPQRTYLETIRQIKEISRKIAKALEIHGPFNIQFVARDNDVFVIECNLRASRSMPFVSKIYRVNFIDRATQVMMGIDVPRIDKSFMELNYVGVKAPQFSFTRLQGADPTLGVEMASTGEVACIGQDFEEAFLKALLSVGYRLPIKKVLISSGPLETKAKLLKYLQRATEMGIEFYATEGTAAFMHDAGLNAQPVGWPLDKESGKKSDLPGAIDIIKEGKVDLVINIPKNFQEEELTNDYMIRRAAVDYNIPLITNVQIAKRLVQAMLRKSKDDLLIKSWKSYRG